MDGDQQVRATGESAFAAELQLRIAEARTSLQAADALGDPLLAQIAEADLADLTSLAARNDVAVEADAGTGAVDPR